MDGVEWELSSEKGCMEITAAWQKYSWVFSGQLLVSPLHRRQLWHLPVSLLRSLFSLPAIHLFGQSACRRGLTRIYMI